MKHDLKSLIEEIMRDSHVMTLCVSDEKGPWGAPVIFVNDNLLNLYWVSMPKSRHSLSIDNFESKASCVIIADDKTNNERAIQIEGKAERVKGKDMFDFAIQMEKKRGKPLPTSNSDFLSKGHVWYMLKPDSIFLMNSKLFGYERISFLPEGNSTT